MLLEALESIPEAFTEPCCERKLQWNLTLGQEATPPSVSKLKLMAAHQSFLGRSTTVLHRRGSESSPELPNSTSRSSRRGNLNMICYIGQFNSVFRAASSLTWVFPGSFRKQQCLAAAGFLCNYSSQ